MSGRSDAIMMVREEVVCTSIGIIKARLEEMASYWQYKQWREYGKV